MEVKEGQGRSWKVMEGQGRSWKIDISGEKSYVWGWWGGGGPSGLY